MKITAKSASETILDIGKHLTELGKL